MRKEYKVINSKKEDASFFIDCYKCFGWEIDENINDEKKVHLKRDMEISNHMELTRLQNHFEASVEDLIELERTRKDKCIFFTALHVLIGTAFMALAVFAITAPVPDYILCSAFGVIGFAFWISTPFLNKVIKRKEKKRFDPLMQAKLEEIDEICGKGAALL